MVSPSVACSFSLFMRQRGYTQYDLLFLHSGYLEWHTHQQIYQGANNKDLARDFTYIDDIVKGCVASLDTAERSTGSGGKKTGPAQLRIFNLGNTSPVTVPTLVDILEKYLNMKAIRNIVKMPRNGDVPFTHANVSSAQTQLNYKPITDLDTGLKKFVKWYLSYYGDNTHHHSGLVNQEPII